MKRTLALFLSIILLLPAACAEPPVTDEQGRREIVMAYLMLGDADSPFIYKEEIDAFQNRNPDYFITRVNYFADYVPNWKPRYPELGAANTVFWDPDYTEAYREAKQQLNTDLTVKAKSRKTPDILIIHNASEYHEYARAGVLADLTEYYERDIDQSAVFENFFAAMQVEGKLYGLADGFYPQGLYMDRQFAGLDRSLAAMLALQKELDYPLLGDTDKMEAFNSWLRLYLHEFIDWETYRCDFGNSNFTAILEMAESTPEIPETTYFDLANKAAGTQKPFFVSKGVTVADYQAMSLLFGGNMAFANYPAENPNGFSGAEDALAVYVGSIYAIAKNSRYKDLAWDYIKAIVSEEYQKKHVATSMNQMS
ncbi:MAG: hypothetical protein LBI54_06860, partial [Lachnospiraceae bacterium]|nr:hypothetical protein [Lachnospiraceae bacterium]